MVLSEDEQHFLKKILSEDESNLEVKGNSRKPLCTTDNSVVYKEEMPNIEN